MDFSDTREAIAAMPARFWAGVPKVPNKKKEAMSIYTCFIQHVINSLKPNTGKGAIVVPTGFITAGSGVEGKILKKIIDDKIVYGCVSMPSNVFANTGTNVSVLFIDKSNTNGDVLLMDASKLGKKVKIGKNQKTVLSKEELDLIVNYFVDHIVKEDFSVSVTYDQIKEKNYSFSAGQYFDVKIEYSELTQLEFREKINEYKSNLNNLIYQNKLLEDEIKKSLEDIKYE